MKKPFVRATLAVASTTLAFVIGCATAISDRTANAPDRPAEQASPSAADASRSAAAAARDGPMASDAPLSPEDLATAVRQARTGLSSDTALQDLIRKLIAWTRVDPDAALAYAREEFTLSRRDHILSALLSDWTQRDPRAAWAWVGEQAACNAQCVDAVLSVLGKTDPGLTRDFADDFSRKNPGLARPTYVSALRGILYAGDYELATRMIGEADWSAVPEGREALSRLLVSMWGQYEPEPAAEWALHLPDPAAREQALLGLGESWASTEPAAAAGFAATLPAGEVRRTLVTQAVTNWVQHDQGAVSSWLAQQPPDDDFDEAITWLATHPALARDDTNAALHWANRITDRELRTQTLVRVLTSRDGASAQTALAYLQTSAVPADLRAEVCRRIENGDIYQAAEAAHAAN